MVFRKRSCEKALPIIKHELIKTFEHRLYFLGPYIDFRKAFDSVCHEVLTYELSKYGIHGMMVLELMKRCLVNRCQYVCLNNSASANVNITRGVSQGSILNALLFIIYINFL